MSREVYQAAVAERFREIQEAQQWANERRDEVVAHLKELGFDDRFIGGHFMGWAHSLGVYR